MTAVFDVLGIGCVAVDDVLFVGTFPEPDEKMRIRRSERRFGGLTGAALVTAATLGGKCAFAGRLGHDDLSVAVEQNLIDAGIDVANVVRRSEAAPVHSVIVAAEDAGTRNIFFDASAPTGADPELPSEEVIRSASVLFLDSLGVQGGIRAATIAREALISVVADIEGDREPGTDRLMALVDHLIVSDGFARRLTGLSDARSAAQALWSTRSETVVVTCGREGAWYLCSKAPDTVEHQPAFEVEATDTTGCGDVFHGAYALALAKGSDTRSRIRFAAAAAALKATLGGAFPNYRQVQVLLESGSERRRAEVS